MKNLKILLLTTILIAGLPAQALDLAKISRFASQNKLLTAGIIAGLSLIAYYCFKTESETTDTNHLDQSHETISTEQQTKFQKYCNKIELGFCGDEITLKAMANILNVSIKVYDYDHTNKYEEDHLAGTFTPEDDNSDIDIKIVIDQYSNIVRYPGILTPIKGYEKAYKSYKNAQFDCVIAALKCCNINTTHNVEELRAQVAQHIRNNRNLKKYFISIYCQNSTNLS